MSKKSLKNEDPSEIQALARNKIQNLVKQLSEMGLNDVLEVLIVTKPKNNLPFSANGSPGFERLMEDTTFSNQVRTAFSLQEESYSILDYSRVKFDSDDRNYARALLLYGACMLFY